MSKTKIALIAYLSTAIALIIGIGFLCVNEKLLTDTKPLTWFIVQIVAMTVGVSFTLQYAASQWFNADGVYEPDEAASTAVIGGAGALVTALVLLYAQHETRWDLALNLFLFFEVIVFVLLGLFWSGPAVSKSGHAHMAGHASAIRTTPTTVVGTTTPDKPMSIGMIIGIILLIAVISRLAMCSTTTSTSSTGNANPGKEDPVRSSTPAVSTPTPTEGVSVPPTGWNPVSTQQVTTVEFSDQEDQGDNEDGITGAMNK